MQCKIIRDILSRKVRHGPLVLEPARVPHGRRRLDKVVLPDLPGRVQLAAVVDLDVLEEAVGADRCW